MLGTVKAVPLLGVLSNYRVSGCVQYPGRVLWRLVLAEVGLYEERSDEDAAGHAWGSRQD
jgi:hypothetical protein